MYFEVLGEIGAAETIAVGRHIRTLAQLRKQHGGTRWRKRKRFLLCIRNKGCEDLQLRKLYECLPDPRGAKEGLIRVIDESGEDYLYPATHFVTVELPREAERALAAGSRRP